MKIPKLLIIYMMILGPLMFFCMSMLMLEKANISYYGFAIDSDGNIYLGKSSTIQVVDRSGMEIRSIRSMTSRGYNFTIIDDQIYLDTAAHYYIMDLYGNILDEGEGTEENESRFPKINSLGFIDASRFTDSAGNRYIMRTRFLRTVIYQYHDGIRTEIYQMPLFDYFTRLLLIACCVSMAIFIPINLVRWRKMA